MNFDPHQYPFPSRRNLLYAKNGCVAASHPAAAGIGLDILRRGGNAVDAAIAAAAALAVLEPASNGLGSDCFALVHDGEKLHGLNASGWAPRALTPEVLAERGFAEIPRCGWEPVTVPGAPAGWEALRERFGTLDAEDLLAPLCEALSGGVPVPPTIARNWGRAFELYRRESAAPGPAADGRPAGAESAGSPSRAALFRPWFDTFAPGGRAPRAGEPWRSGEQQRTLEALRREGFRAFYEGSPAEALLDYSRRTGGYLEEEDLRLYRPEWVEPVSVHYKGVDVWEIPPNGQGITALMALGMLAEDDLKGFEDPEDLHRAIEAMKLAFADVLEYVADPAAMILRPRSLLDPGYLRERRALIAGLALDPRPGRPPAGGTVYLATADRNGMMVSFIQSNYMGFGSGLVVPGWGISLQNRGYNFSLREGHPNCLAGRKRPYHTIIPGFLTRGGRALGLFGVMGGYMQPQGHMQVVMNLVDYRMNPQAALDAPRWQWTAGKKVLFEPEFLPETLAALSRRGHLAVVEEDPTSFGRGQIILRDENGVYAAGTEKRCDGYLAVY
jgi:gamma-glutamyltranspeptidase/glutathione hydrolase